METYAGNEVAPTSASWLSGGCFQRQIRSQAARVKLLKAARVKLLQAALGYPRLRPASAHQPLGAALAGHLGLVLDMDVRR